MVYALGDSFRIENILKSEQGKYLTVTRWWWDNYEKLPVKAFVGGESNDPYFIQMNKYAPLKYDGISKKYRAPQGSYTAPPF